MTFTLMKPANCNCVPPSWDAPYGEMCEWCETADERADLESLAVTERPSDTSPRAVPLFVTRLPDETGSPLPPAMKCPVSGWPCYLKGCLDPLKCYLHGTGQIK